MPMRKILLTTIGILIWTSGLPCSCNFMGNFLKATSQADIVAIIRIKDYGDYFKLEGASPQTINQPLSVTVEIVSVLRGLEDRKEVKIFGDDGVLCRPYINVFKKDRYYVVGLYKCGNADREGIKETPNDYQTSACGEFWIDYNPDNKTVRGRIRKNKRKPTIMTLDKFEKLLK